MCAQRIAEVVGSGMEAYSGRTFLFFMLITHGSITFVSVLSNIEW